MKDTDRTADRTGDHVRYFLFCMPAGSGTGGSSGDIVMKLSLIHILMAVTFTALGMTITKLSGALFTTGLDMGNTLQLIFAILLLILGVLVAIQGVKKLFEKQKA